MSDLTKRVLLAIPGGLVFLLVLWLGGWIFQLGMALLVLLIQREMIVILKNTGYQVNSVFTYLLGVWIMSTPLIEAGHQLLPGVALFLVLTAYLVVERGQLFLEKLMSTVFLGLYAPLGFLALVLLRAQGSDFEGLFLALVVVFMVWGNDVLAYFGGKNFGKHLLAPSISPKKTWEGFVSGILGSGLGLALCYLVLPVTPGFHWAFAIPLVLISSVFGPVGDLVESRFKREAGIKDSSSLLPGHGGLFDRFDAMILSALSVFVYIQFLDLLNYAPF